MTQPSELTLPSVEVALHEVRAMAYAGEIEMCQYANIRAAVLDPSHVDPMVALAYKSGGAAALLSIGALLPEGVYPALVAAILPKKEDTP